MYSIIEEEISPIMMEINGEKTRYYIFTVPKQGEAKVDFTLSGLPNGKHIVYIYSN
ncbi:hypothetical protein OXB_2153 [Bacillus sp. OxB-1]|nr:hypothetical protein OXB_2153 [Bacillus sp. OxB-1]